MKKNFAPTPKNFGVKPKEILPQPQKSLDETIIKIYLIKIYLINLDLINLDLINLDLINLQFFKMKKNEFNHKNQTQLQEQQLETSLQFKTVSSSNTQQQADNTNFSSANITTGATRMNTVLQTVINSPYANELF